MALTATDMAPLCGVHQKACLRKYGSKPLRTEYCHELAVRILIGCLITTAAKYDMGVKPIFSHSTDHYIRVYVTLEHGAEKADKGIREMGYVLHCFKCFNREAVIGMFAVKLHDRCSECSSKLDFAGPLFLGKISDGDFCKMVEAEAESREFKLRRRAREILRLIRCETDAPPTYYVIDKLCGKLKLPVPSIKVVIEALKASGFQALPTHFNPKGVKTNASAMEVKEVLRKVVTSRS